MLVLIQSTSILLSRLSDTHNILLSHSRCADLVDFERTKMLKGLQQETVMHFGDGKKQSSEKDFKLMFSGIQVTIQYRLKLICLFFIRRSHTTDEKMVN